MLSVTAQKAFISFNINGLLLQVLLWGIYTAVYLATLSLYLSKKSARHWTIIAAISLSYCGYTTDALLVWYLTQSQFVNGSETRQSLFVALVSSPGWLILVNDVIIVVMAAVADGILIWRCYSVWNRSQRPMLLPIFLLFCEIAVDIALITLQYTEHFTHSGKQSLITNYLIASQGFITFTATLSATLLIAYRIYTSSTKDMSRQSRKLFTQIVEILVQSAALYSIAALAYAVAAVIPETPGNLASLNATWTYTSILFLFAIGFSPTLIVARVSFLDHSKPSIGNPHVSDLKFNVQSANQEDRTRE